MSVETDVVKLFQDSLAVGEDIAQVIMDLGGAEAIANLFAKRKLGRIKSAENDLKRRLWIKKYLPKQGVPVPAATNWRAAAAKSLADAQKNNSLGDCTCAGVAHCIGVVTANESQEVVIPDADTVKFYYGITHGKDDGADLGTVLKTWSKPGLDGHTLGAYAAVDLTNINEIKTCINEFGPLYVGLNLPHSWWANPEAGWNLTTNKPDRIIGGHCVVIVDYDETQLYTSTWGLIVPTSYDAVTSGKYFDEGYTVLAPDWYSEGFCPSGFDTETLLADIKAVQA
jgi:hypothetical protein